MWLLNEKVRQSVVAIMIACFVCSMCSAQVTAKDFNGLEGLSANDFLGLASKWENEAQYAVFHDGMTDRQLFGAQAEVKTLERCARELRELVSPKPDVLGLLVSQQEVPAESFGQVPIRPQPLPRVPDYGPGGPTPTKPLQAPSQVQAKSQAVQACSVGYTQVYSQPVQAIGRGGGWRPFQWIRNRRASRSAGRGFGGC